MNNTIIIISITISIIFVIITIVTYIIITNIHHYHYYHSGHPNYQHYRPLVRLIRKSKLKLEKNTNSCVCFITLVPFRCGIWTNCAFLPVEALTDQNNTINPKPGISFNVLTRTLAFLVFIEVCVPPKKISYYNYSYYHHYCYYLCYCRFSKGLGT